MKIVENRISLSKEFSHLNFKDKRMQKNFKSFAKLFEANKSGSFSSICGSKRKSIAGILGNRAMSHQEFHKGHHKELLKRSKHEPIVLVAQDTTSFNYASHKATEGLGSIGTTTTIQGLLMHSSLAMTEGGLPLGLIHQDLWARNDQNFGKKHLRRKLDIEDKESNKWLKSEKAVIEFFKKSKNEVFILSDRESDVIDYIAHQRPKNIHILFRALQPRTVDFTISEQTLSCKLPDVYKYLPILSTKTILIDKANKTETIELEIYNSNISIFPPKHRKEFKIPVEMSLIVARERTATNKGNKSELEWILLCDKKNLSKEECLKMLDYYTQRWKIERFHFTLKTGVFNVEK